MPAKKTGGQEVKYAKHENLPKICRDCLNLDDMETTDGDFACWICKLGLIFPKNDCNKKVPKTHS